jgi:hypothetical protein
VRVISYLFLSAAVASAAPVELSGIYPHLSFFNDERECGTGAVVPWGDRLWAITYAPHSPKGSTDKLYEITNDLQLIVRQESIGGTPANRMIHKESNQLFIGPYAIDKNRHVRTIQYSRMTGRPTGNARHLFDPAGKIYYATMEEGIYEVDVHTLNVTELFRDEEVPGDARRMEMSGYHGKGLYTGHGRLIYANNGERGRQNRFPESASGALAEWDGKSDKWHMVRRNQFCEVTGPGGIYGNENPDTDPIWTTGWDHRSLILMVLDKGEWHSYRLPKGSHSYDGAHGHNTEWPRIREIGEGNDLLMTMHGTFYKFPKDFTPAKSGGIVPRSNYLKVIGDFAKWNGRIVFGCDDTARSEFANVRQAKGKIAQPQSQSNLWFMEPDKIDDIGPLLGRGALAVDDPLKKGEPTDPFLFSGYDLRGVHLSHDGKGELTFEFEVDKNGTGNWEPLLKLPVRPNMETFHSFTDDQAGAWVRVKVSEDVAKGNISFIFRDRDDRTEKSAAIFNGLADAGSKNLTGGLVRARDGEKRDLAFAAVSPDGKDIGFYLLNDKLELVRTENPQDLDFHKKNTGIPTGMLTEDAASVIFSDDEGKKWRLPKNAEGYENGGTFGGNRIAREVATERDLFNAYGTFYELPSRNAGSFSRVRPVATHNRAVHDFCSYRGLFVASGVSTDAPADNKHIIRSDDGKAALWAGNVDDLWKLGKPRGKGGPWKDTSAKRGEASDPYLMTAYDKKTLTLTADQDIIIRMEVDIAGNGTWVNHHRFEVNAGLPLEHVFPEAFSAYWCRFTTSADAKVTAQLAYE